MQTCRILLYEYYKKESMRPFDIEPDEWENPEVQNQQFYFQLIFQHFIWANVQEGTDPIISTSHQASPSVHFK